MSDAARRNAPSAERNRGPILEVLQRVFLPTARVLEVAAGTGQHAAWCAAGMPGVTWQPTDRDAANLASIDAWTAELRPRVRAARVFDVVADPWPDEPYDAVLCVNMIHIAPWEAAEALVRGAGAGLAAGGVLALYGPYRRGGAHTAESNAAFEGWLKGQDARYGVRDLEAVAALAEAAGFGEPEAVPMPANNFTVVFRRR